MLDEIPNGSNNSSFPDKEQEKAAISSEDAKVAKPATDEDSDFIPMSIYESLPSLLKESCEVFNDRYEKDIYLTGALAVLGGCFHNLSAYNSVDKKSVATNLLAIVVGPPASGKGALNYARKLARKIKETFSANRKKAFSNSSGKLFIPANISSAGMIQLLAMNKGVGVMVESEIDTIVNANRQEWGNYSEIIRKSFENEEYTMYRKGKDHAEFSEIEQLQLSIAISGTKGQFKQLIFSADNGLFSRGTYYVFDPSDEKFKFLGRMNSNVDINEKFASFAKIANDCYALHLSYENIQVVFSRPQLEQISEELQGIKDRHGDIVEFHGNIKRAFIAAQKIAALISFLSECEKGVLNETIACSDEILNTSILLTKIYLWHADSAFNLLPSGTFTNINETQQRLLLVLPEEFTKGEGINAGKRIGIKQRSAYNAFEALERKGLIELQTTGKYKKK